MNNELFPFRKQLNNVPFYDKKQFANSKNVIIFVFRVADTMPFGLLSASSER
jgi:hypothetical protein